ncbi:MAG: peptidase M13, partial [Rhodococcus sp. (in: high G+C Gram-positive bacteria)]
MTAVVNSGIDLSYADPDTRAQDDLFVHVNGKWLDDYVIPADRAVDGAFRTLYDKAEEDVRAIIQESAASNSPVGTDAQKIGDLYSSFLDADAVEEAGLTPISEELAAVADATDLVTLAGVLGGLQRTGIGGAIGHYVDTDAKDSTRYLVHFSQSGIGLPDESYYREENYAEIRSAYVAHISKMFTLAGVGYDADRVFDLEKKLAAGHWDVVARRDAEKGYNLVEFDTLVRDEPGFDWT